MNNPQEDIVLIRKYHSGELSPAEKNQLEARALNDPFLQDALDGYELRGVKDDDILFLRQKLDSRIKSAKVIAPVWGLKHWGIAASILLCIAVASIYFNQTPKNQAIALNELQKKEDIPLAEKSKIISEKDTADETVNQIAQITPSAEINTNPVPDHVPNSYAPEPDIVVAPLAESTSKKASVAELDEVVVVGYGTQSRKDITGSVSEIKGEALAASNSKMTRLAKEVPLKLKGKIIDEKDSTALPGVSIKNMETGVTQQTDANGEFTIDAIKNSDLVFSYIGYESKQAVVKASDPMLITLKPDGASLSETVVVGYGKQKAEMSATVGPKVGWKRFKTYIDQQANTINIGRGKVEVQFVINPTGELSDFKIIETFSAKASVAAINLIKNYGGGWTGSSDKIPHKANITIKFR